LEGDLGVLSIEVPADFDCIGGYSETSRSEVQNRMTAKIKFWQWPNILAIDASLIAVAWLWVFAREQGADLAPAAYAVLATSVWLTYLSDRLFDAGSRDEAELLSARHKLAKHRARPLWSDWTAVLVVNLGIALTGLTTAQLQKGIVLLVLCLAYTASNHFLSKRFFPKELCVALIFTGGIQVFLPGPLDGPGAIGFALLCLSNCLCIGWKEAAVDTSLKVRSLSSISNPRWSYPFLTAAAGFSFFSSGSSALLPCILFLLTTQILRRHFRPEFFRVLCDASLFIGPLVYTFFSGVFVR
jgi:hypothetical protein